MSLTQYLLKVDSGKITKDKIQDKEEFTRNRSPRAIRNKTNKYNGNITKRGTIEVKVLLLIQTRLIN